MTESSRKSGTICSAFFTILSVYLATNSPAKSQGLGPPPVASLVDENGFDFMTGAMSISIDDLKIGLAQTEDSTKPRAAISFSRQIVENGWRHNYQLTVQQGGLLVNLGSHGKTLTASGSSPTKTGEMLSLTGSIYTYTYPDGTIIHFDKYFNVYYPALDETQGLATEVIFPSGEKLSFAYKMTTVSGVLFARLQSVSSSYGYLLKYEYYTDSAPTSLNNMSWLAISKVSAINLAIDSCNPSSDHCTGLTRTWPNVTYTQTGPNQEVDTDPTGAATRYTWDTSIGNYVNIRPADSTVDTVVVGADDVYATFITRNGVKFRYGAGYCGGVLCQRVVGPNGFFRGVVTKSSTALGNPEVIEDWDSNGNKTTFEYDDFDRKTKIIQPEGNYVKYSYDDRGNVTETRFVAKPGSGVADIVTTAAFPLTCTNPLTCNRPTSATDANNNTTTYTYDAAHGGLLTKTGPAVNGIQPVVRYSWAQRYAWVSNGAGGYVHGSAPIWILANTRTCRTTTTVGNACAGGATDEIVTTYDYGPDSGPNNLLLGGIVVTADGTSLRTCLGYDAIGNQIWSTSPRAGLVSCS